MDLLQRLYEDPRYGLSASKLYEKAKKLDSNITHKMVKEFLQKQSTNQIFTQRKVKHYYPLVADSVFFRLQCDLMDVSNMDPVGNKQRKFLFCCVDVFTRYAFVYPQLNKSEKSCIESLKKVIKEIKDAKFKIHQLDSDAESAFLSRSFQKICADNGITQNVIYPIEGKHQLGIVERFNRTVRSLINHYRVLKKTSIWIDVLPKLIENYNDSVHSALDKISPFEAVATKQGITKYIQVRTEKAINQNYNKQVISVGDKVRLRLKRELLEKPREIWSKTIHTVVRVDGRNIYVSDRVNSYSKETLLKIDSNTKEQDDEERKVDKEEHERKIDRRVNRRIRKEGVNRKDETTEQEKNDRALRTYRKQRDRGFYLG